MAYCQIISLETFVPGALIIQPRKDADEFAATLRGTKLLNESDVARHTQTYADSPATVGRCSYQRDQIWLVYVIAPEQNEVVSILSHELTHLADFLCGTGSDTYETRARVVEAVMEKFLAKYKPETPTATRPTWDDNYISGLVIVGGGILVVGALISQFFYIYQKFFG